MAFFQWLNVISQSTAPGGKAFAASWVYVALALLLPLVIGAAFAGLIRVIEKTSGIKLGGGSA